MKKFTLIFLVCAVLAVAMSQPIPEEETAKPEEAQDRALDRPTLGQIADRFTSALRLTAKDSGATFNEATRETIAAARQAIRAGLSAARAGLQVLMAIPALGRNILIDTEKINAELALDS